MMFVVRPLFVGFSIFALAGGLAGCGETKSDTKDSKMKDKMEGDKMKDKMMDGDKMKDKMMDGDKMKDKMMDGDKMKDTKMKMEK